jgi:hypothetical protein
MNTMTSANTAGSWGLKPRRNAALVADAMAEDGSVVNLPSRKMGEPIRDPYRHAGSHGIT